MIKLIFDDTQDNYVDLDENSHRFTDGLDLVMDHRLEQFERSLDDADFGGDYE